MTRGKRKSSYPSYSIARSQAIDLQLGSTNKYRQYIKKNKIKHLPAYPERVYKDWISWNDYLGTNNKFMGELKKVVRPYWDAVKFAQQFCADNKIDTGDQWLAWVKAHKGELPNDIPAYPDSKYLEWEGWKVWLGNDVRSRIETAKVSTALICFCNKQSLSVPGNMYTIIQAEMGESELRSVLAKDPSLVVYRCYKMENQLKEQVMTLINQFARHDGDGWFCPLINQLIMELDLLLIPFRG